MKISLIIFSCLSIFLSTKLSAQNRSSLNEYKIFELPDVNGRLDHMTIDLKSDRLFVAALGNGTVEVIELKSGKILHSIKDLDKPQGVLYLPGNDLLLVTSADDGTCKIFSASNFKLLKQFQFESDADNIRFDKKREIAFVGFDSGGIAAIDVLNLKLLYKIVLPAHPESFQIDEDNGKMFVNVPDVNQLIVIDLVKKMITERVKLGIKNNFPMALDLKHQIIFIGVRNPPKLILIDANSLNIISEKNISGDADDIYYDQSDSLIFVSCGSGFIDIIKFVNYKDMSLKEEIKTYPGTRTSLYVPELKKFFVAVRKQDESNARIIEYSINP